MLYKNIAELKKKTKPYGIIVKHTKSTVILLPSPGYIRKYGDGDKQKAIDDLKSWFGLVGSIDEKGRVHMQPRE